MYNIHKLCRHVHNLSIYLFVTCPSIPYVNQKPTTHHLYMYEEKIIYSKLTNSSIPSKSNSSGPPSGG